MKRLRFQLRTLLVAVAILAVGLGWFVNWWQSRPNFLMLTLGGSQAMEPLLNGREYLAIDMNAYRRTSPTRWEAVACRLQQPSQPGRAATASILRVVGLPGETVSFSDGKIVIDGQPLEPPHFVPPRPQRQSSSHRSIEHLHGVRYHSDASDTEVLPHPYKVPDGCYYLLGDNPNAAIDSRMWGALPAAEILGRYPVQLSEPTMWPGLGVAVLLAFVVLTVWRVASQRHRSCRPDSPT